MKKYLLIIISSLFILTSCFKEDSPLPDFPMQTTTIQLTQNDNYLYQVYFNLAENKVVSTNEKNDFDLEFECGDSSWHIRLNTSAFMMAANTGEKDLAQVTDTTGADWRFDKSDGNPDSTAVGQWLEINGQDTVYPGNVYVVNRGYNHKGNPRGLQKIIFQKVDTASYRIAYADINGDNYNAFTITKNRQAEYTFFSFDNGGQQLTLEPPPDSWDLLFTQYTTLLFTTTGQPYPYLVTGVLTNYGKVSGAIDSTMDYESIDLNFAKSRAYSIQWDFIGYDWKKLVGDVNANPTYEIVKGRNYLIRTDEGIYYKLRFINYYNENGLKGYPTFQYDVL